ncbi:MAG: c-type cytochrome [Isosphaeraceae bacterium]
MSAPTHIRRSVPLTGGLVAMFFTIVFFTATVSPSKGGDHPWGSFFHKHFGHEEVPPGQIATLNGGAWYWMRSPEQEKTVVMNLFNRYCIRCHGVDGRGVWDIPGIPDFTDVRWQNYRTDAEIVRIIIEGRGAVMPQFRGALALDEAWGLAHYLRSFVPGTEMSRPEVRNPPGQAQSSTNARSATSPASASTTASGGAASASTPPASPPGANSGESSPFAR